MGDPNAGEPVPSSTHRAPHPLRHHAESRIFTDATSLVRSRSRITVSEPLATIVCNAADMEIHKAWVVDTRRRPDGCQTHARRRVRAGQLRTRTHAATGHRPRSTCSSAPTSTRSWSACTPAPTRRPMVRPRSSPLRRWKRPTLGAPSPAGMSRTARPTFGVTLVVEDGLMAISNMHEVSSTVLSTGKRSVRFADTPLMSTYLVAFVVGELEATRTDRCRRRPAAGHRPTRHTRPIRLRPRSRCVRPPLLPTVVRHPLPGQRSST